MGKPKRPELSDELTALWAEEEWVLRHLDRVRPQIEELDRKDAESMAKAPQIAVSNATKK